MLLEAFDLTLDVVRDDYLNWRTEIKESNSKEEEL